MKKRRVLSGVLAGFMCVSLNINPLATIAGAIYDTGVFSDIAILNNNLYLLASGQADISKAANEEGARFNFITDTYSGGCNCPDYTDVLDGIRENTGRNAEDAAEIRKDVATIKGYDKDILDTVKSIDATTKAILKDTDYIIQQLGYDPTAQTVKPKNVRESFERVSDQLSEITHEYRVANIHSLNAEFGGSLWNPTSEEIPNLEAYCEITGGFAQVYSGYWDTAVSTVNNGILPETQALKILGQDAIIRSEGLLPVAVTATTQIGKGSDLTAVVLVPSAENVIGASGRSNAIEVVGTDETGSEDVTYNDWGQITDSYDLSEFIPTSQTLYLQQSIIPSENITWLDAVTVLYKALGDEQITLSGIYSRDPDITPESSPLAQNLSGISDYWQGYNYYVFASRANPTYATIQGDSIVTKTDYVYWQKAVEDGFVNYFNRGETINCIEFYALARQMMEAYGEPVLTDNEMQTLLQVYGSYYPVQMGDKAAKSWAFLKARGILTESNMPENYTDNITRNQLLDICARIKDTDYRETFKNIELSISLNDLVVDSGYYPYYDFEISLEEDVTFEGQIDYTTSDYYTYLFPMQADVNLGYGGTAICFTEPDRHGSVYSNYVFNGMVYLNDDTGGHYFYVLQLPKTLTKPVYLSFVDIDDLDKKYGSVDFIELNSKFLTGGIFTQYVLSEDEGVSIATLADAEYGVNYFSFADFPNNMDLIYYVDQLRQDLNYTTEVVSIKKTRYTEPTSIAGPVEQLVAFYNKMTTPLIAQAYEVPGLQVGGGPGTSPKVTNSWTVSISTDDEGNEDGFYVKGPSDFNTSSCIENISGFKTADGREVYYYQDTNQGLQRVKSNAGLLFAARAALISDWDYPNWKTSSVPNQRTRLQNVVGGTDYANILNGVTPANSAFDAQDFLALYATGVNGVSDRPASAANEDLHSTEVRSSLQKEMLNNSMNSKITDALSAVFSADNKFKVGPLASDAVADGKTVWVRIRSAGNSSATTVFRSKFDQLLNDKDSASTTAAGLDALGSGALDTDLSTSVIMSTDKQIMISWNDMVKYGIAKSIKADGLPTIDDVDGIYEFYTTDSVVRIDEINHILQVGTTLYTFHGDSDDQIPKLVVTDTKGNLYFDSRAITGIVTKTGYTLNAGTAATADATILGDAHYMVMQLSSKGTQNASSYQKQYSIYTVGDSPAINGSAFAPVAESALKDYLITSTTYDGLTNQTGTFTYWGADRAASARMGLTNTYPIANWIITCNTDNYEISGRLYVFYLKKAFTEGFADSPGGIDTPYASSAFDSYWEDNMSVAQARLTKNYPSLVSELEDKFNVFFEEDSDQWYATMSKYALYNLVADTGVLYFSPNFIVRCFDITTASPANCIMNTDMREAELKKGDSAEQSIGNNAGALYFLDFLGFVYNLPSVEEFSLADYYAGKYPLPIAFDNVHQTIINYNLNYYGSDCNGDSVPLGYDLTDVGFVHYTAIKENDPSVGVIGDPSKYTFDKNTTSQPPVFDANTYITAPVGLYTKYGLYHNAKYDYEINEISQSMTKMNAFFFGSRYTQMSDAMQSTNTNIRYFDIGSRSYAPIGIPANTTAYLANKRLLSNGTHFDTYIIDTNDLSAYTMEDQGLNRVDFATPEIEWNGRTTLYYILDYIDRGTSWWIWICLTLAPFLCIILMTLLIGASFLTENKIWQSFCANVFDPVKILTFGKRDSTNWNWRTVLAPCIITYCAFALFRNANIIRIIVFIFDGVARLLQSM